MKMKIVIPLVAAAALLTCAPAMASEAPVDTAGREAQGLSCEKDPFCQRKAWDEEFNRICAQTGVATALEAAQLQKLINDSDELLPRLEALPPDQARLYSFRLESCRSFLTYALQLLEQQATD